MRVLVVLVACGVLVACSGDPCDGRGAVCISLTVKGTLTGIDQLSVTVDQPVTKAESTPTKPFSLPAKLGLNLPASVSGLVNIDVTALDQGAAIGAGEGQANVTNGHGSATVTLSGSELSADLAGADFLGVDLAGVPRVPGAPTNIVASSGDAQATVIWSPPADPGSSPITSYTVVASPGPTTMTTSDTMITFTGLTDGTSYTFSVAAINAVGTGPAASSNSVTPQVPAPPAAPTNVMATANVDHGATVSWTAADNRGSPLQGYALFATNGTTTVGVGSAGPTAVSAPVTGLTPGTQYTFTLTATNGVGTSPQSAPSNAITAGTLPGAPTGVTASPTVIHTASVTWSAPASDGFSPILRYTVTASPGGASVVTPNGNTLAAQITGLTPSVSYTFNVVATNLIGDSPGASSSAISDCNSPMENCFNGIDDNCDGKVDCADPECGGVGVCVPSQGGAQYGTYVTGTPTCPSGLAGATLYANFGQPSCQGCGQAPATGTPTLTFWSSSNGSCSGSTVIAATGTGCTNLLSTGGSYDVSLTGMSCPAVAGSVYVDFMYATDEFCAAPAVGAGCTPGNVCAPVVGGDMTCILVDSGTLCGGSYPNDQTDALYTAVHNDFSCTACSSLSATPNVFFKEAGPPSDASCAYALGNDAASQGKCLTYTLGGGGYYGVIASGANPWCNPTYISTGSAGPSGTAYRACCM